MTPIVQSMDPVRENHSEMEYMSNFDTDYTSYMQAMPSIPSVSRIKLAEMDGMGQNRTERLKTKNNRKKNGWDGNRALFMPIVHAHVNVNEYVCIFWAPTVCTYIVPPQIHPHRT